MRAAVVLHATSGADPIPPRRTSVTMMLLKNGWEDKLPTGAQLFRFCLLSTLEIIVRLQDEKPGTLAITDRTCLLEVLFRSIPQ